MRPEKQAIAEEIRAEVNGATFLIVAEYRGMKVDQFNELRSQLRKTGARMLVVKNRLLKHVANERGWTDLQVLLKGQSAMVTGHDVVQTAKVLRQFNVATKVPAIRGGMMGDRYLSSTDVESLAALPPRETLLGMVVGTVAAPLTRLVGVMQQKVASLVYVLRAIEDKKSAK
jgi:large subunit ribosomal protein L10